MAKQKRIAIMLLTFVACDMQFTAGLIEKLAGVQKKPAKPHPSSGSQGGGIPQWVLHRDSDAVFVAEARCHKEVTANHPFCFSLHFSTSMYTEHF
jgi:hypothetical protein